jgi:rhodanese-related sulfurtransferase
VVFDARPHREYTVSHIPRALNVSAKPGIPISQYVSDIAEIGRLIKHDKTTPIVLYCNGPFCGKSKRLATELLEAGYTHVRRYQLGIPVWHALGGLTEIELDGVLYILGEDRTAVLIDARDPAEFQSHTLPGARNLPHSSVKPGKDAGERPPRTMGTCRWKTITLYHCLWAGWGTGAGRDRSHCAGSVP